MWGRGSRQRKSVRRRKHAVALAEVESGKRDSYVWEGLLRTSDPELDRTRIRVVSTLH